MKKSAIFPYLAVMLAGITLATYVHVILLKRGVPHVPGIPFIVLLSVCTGFLLFFLHFLSRLTQFACTQEIATIRRGHSVTLLSFLGFWPYIMTQKDVQDPILDLYFVELPLDTMYGFLVLFLCATAAIGVIVRLRQRQDEPAARSFGVILAFLLLHAALGLSWIVLGFRAYDLCLLNAERERLGRFTIEDVTRNVQNTIIPSKMSVEYDVSSDTTLHSGFGVPEETIKASTESILYEISLSVPNESPDPWIHREVGAASMPGWFPESLDLDMYAGKTIRLHMSARYADSCFLKDSASVFAYYLRLIFIADARFDAKHRLAFWIPPSLQAKRKGEQTNVVLFGIDTLRADHLSSYQYPRETTPSIDTLAERGARFANCRSVAPWTLPSFFSIMTSVYPSTHSYGTNIRGVRSIEFLVTSFWNVGTIAPDYSLRTLAETLQEHGYYTAGFANNPFVSKDVEMDRGFEEFSTYGPSSREGLDRILPWLEAHQEDKFFLFFHIMDPHPLIADFPYDDAPFRFGERGDPNVLKDESTYDIRIRFCDEQIKRFMAALEKLNLDQSTLVIVTSDHGHEFADHGGYGHGHTTYDEVLRVPLIFYQPGRLAEGTVVSEAISTLDIAPTILQLLDLPVPPYYQGQSLVPLISGERRSTQPIFAEALNLAHEKKAVLLEKYKLIYSTNLNDFELYDVVEDENETENLMTKEPEIADQLTHVLQDFLVQSDHGIHLVLHARSEKHVCRGTLSTNGTFINVRPRSLKDHNVFQTNNASKEIRFTLSGGEESSGFTFDVDPHEASIQLDLAADNESPPTRVFLGSTSQNPQSPPFELDRKLLQALDTSRKAAMHDEGLYIWLKENEREQKPVEIDRKTKEKLEALGYLN